MSRVRMEFSKGDQVRFLSHLDTVKAFERAIRRARIPIAFSEGFNPHPKMNFASALAVGVTSDAEYIDIDLAVEMQAGEVVDRLDRALPPGFSVKAGRLVPDNIPSLMAEVNRTKYEVVAEAGPVDKKDLDDKIGEFMGLNEVVVMKRTKKGPRPRNILPGIIHFSARGDGESLKFSIEAVIGGEVNVRPEEVISAFKERSGLSIDTDALYIKRTGLYIEKDGVLSTPMEV